MAARTPANNMQPPSQVQEDGRIASESASDVGNQNNATTRHSLEPPPRNVIASKVERVLEDPIPYEEIVSAMRN